MFKSGDIIVSYMKFTDTFEIKKRPGVILFEELGNYVVAGITSNPEMKGIPLTKSEGAVKNSVIKTNYIFTIASPLIEKKVFSLSPEKKKLVFKHLQEDLKQLIT